MVNSQGQYLDAVGNTRLNLISFLVMSEFLKYTLLNIPFQTITQGGESKGKDDL